MGAAAGLGRWFVWGAVLLNGGLFQKWRYHSATTPHRALLVCEWPVLGIPWVNSRSSCFCSVQQVWWSLHWVLRPGWADGLVGGAVLLNAEVFQIGRHRSATTATGDLLVCEWPALGMPLATARSDAASAACSRCGGVRSGCYCRLGRWFVGVCTFAE